MPRSEWQELEEEVRRTYDPEKRYVDVSFRFVVHKRTADGEGHELDYALPTVYGGKYDTTDRVYCGPADNVTDITVAPGQLDFLLYEGMPKRKLLLGALGGGKTEIAVRKAWQLICQYPNVYGGYVAPNTDKFETGLKKFLAIGESNGWIRDVRRLRTGVDVLTVNDVLVQFRGAKKASKSGGSPIVGLDWWWAIEDEQAYMTDETLREVDGRGRVFAGYQVFSTATNEAIQEFQSRIRSYDLNPALCKKFPVDGYSNVFSPLSHWENLKATWPEDEFARRIRGAEVPIDGRAFTMFSKENIAPYPQLGVNISERLTGGYKKVIGIDFGTRTNAAAILDPVAGDKNALRDGGDRLWWIRGEYSTNDQPVDWFCEGLVNYMRERFGLEPGQYICFGDPNDKSGKDADKSDYAIARRAGLILHKAPKKTPRHRISMVNALLRAADKKRRLFVEADQHGRHKCPKTVDAFMNLRTKPDGTLDPVRKGSDQDYTHYAEAVALAVLQYERIRGQFSVQIVNA
jgi:hypothetical protein